MKDEYLDEAERYLIEQIEAITAEYKKAVHPYVRRLSEIRSMRPRRIVLPIDAVVLPPTVTDSAGESK